MLVSAHLQFLSDSVSPLCHHLPGPRPAHQAMALAKLTIMLSEPLGLTPAEGAAKTCGTIDTTW